MVKPLPINNQIRGARRFAAPNSIYFRTWFAQQQRKDRKELNSPLLIDTYSGAAAAYSLRPLSKSTTSVIRVRRSSDNTEQDFTAKQITDGTLVSFCGTSNGHVATLYDQSGNGLHATQTVAAEQPKIVAGGTLLKQDGKPAVVFEKGFNTNLRSQISVDFARPTSMFLAMAVYNPSWGLGAHGGKRFVLADFGFSFGPSGGGFSTVGGELGAISQFRLYSLIATNGDFTFYAEGEDVGGSAYIQDQSSATPFVLGARLSTDGTTIDRYMDGNVSELIIYQSDQSQNREAIEANINAHYGIF